MAKFQKQNTGIIKKDLEDIILLKNTRKKYNDETIIELAESIERDTQIQPVIINGKGELEAGYRRFKAHQYLVSQGKPFNNIECIVRNGEHIILNLIENIHRDPLSAEDLEAALKEMFDSGMSKSDIAERIKKRLSWVSDTMKAGEIRNEIEDSGTDTSGISSSALSTMRRVPKKNLKEAAENIKKNGGTVSAAKEEAGKYKNPGKNNNKKALPEEDKKITSDEYMNIPDKNHFHILYDALRVLIRIGYSEEMIIKKASEFMEDSK